MIYIAFEPCSDSTQSRHLAGAAARDRLFCALGITDEVVCDAGGKPRLSHGGAGFSVSHTGTVAVCAVKSDSELEEPHSFTVIAEDAAAGDIGIDIEKIPDSSALPRLKRLAERFLHTDINSPEEFTRLWTRAEAYAKYTGAGLAKAVLPPPEEQILYTFTVSLDGTDYMLSLCI